MTQTDDTDPSSTSNHQPGTFETSVPAVVRGHALVLALDSYEGPLDALLDLAQRQKIDLLQIRVLDLADQYLAFVNEAKRLNLELAAEYLVIAAWLAYLKSRLLLPTEQEEEDVVSADELAERLAFQLRRLEAMRQAADDLLEQPRLGVDTFSRGNPEGVRVIKNTVYQADLVDLLKAYSGQKRRQEAAAPVRVTPRKRYSIDDALSRLRSIVGDVPDWTLLMEFIPRDEKDPGLFREVISATFVATLELARHGEVELRQGAPFAPIYLKRGQEATDI